MNFDDFPKSAYLILESRFWFVAVPAVNRPSFTRLKGNLARLTALAANSIVHLPVATFKSHSFTYFFLHSPAQFSPEVLLDSCSQELELSGFIYYSIINKGLPKRILNLMPRSHNPVVRTQELPSRISG